MHTLIDNQSIIISEGTATVLITAGDPAYEPVRHYLVDEGGDDFDTVYDIVLKLTQSVAARFGPSGIRIDAIAPGFIKQAAAKPEVEE